MVLSIVEAVPWVETYHARQAMILFEPTSSTQGSAA